MRLWLALFLVCLGLTACSDPAPVNTGDAGNDAGNDAGRDGGSDAGHDAGHICLTGEHLCAGSCVADVTNDPSHGCALGCGDPCPTAPDHAMAVCTEAGTCDIACMSPYVRDFDQCTCTPMTCDDLGATCGMVDNGCGTMIPCGMCGANQMCTAGMCACIPDSLEPNNTIGTAHDLGSFADTNNDSTDVTSVSLHSASDYDWFAFDVEDRTDASNPDVEVTLDSIPTGSNYDLEVLYECTHGGNDSACEGGSSAYSDGAGHSGCASRMSGTTRDFVHFSTQCPGTNDESGRAFVRVVPADWHDTCGFYTLHVYVY